jgi:hypothetical protein
MLCIAAMAITPAWAMAMTSKTELYIGGVLFYGLHAGAQQSFCRSLFADLTPRTFESEVCQEDHQIPIPKSFSNALVHHLLCDYFSVL